LISIYYLYVYLLIYFGLCNKSGALTVETFEINDHKFGGPTDTG